MQNFAPLWRTMPFRPAASCVLALAGSLRPDVRVVEPVYTSRFWVQPCR